MKTIHDLTLYDIMAEDTNVWLKKRDSQGFDLYIDVDDLTRVDIIEEKISECAIDSLADFCRRFIHTYDNANKQS